MRVRFTKRIPSRKTTGQTVPTDNGCLNWPDFQGKWKSSERSNTLSQMYPPQSLVHELGLSCYLSSWLYRPRCLGGRHRFWKLHQLTAESEANSRLEVDLFGNFQVDERFRFANTICFGEFIGDEIQQVFMVTAKDLDH